MASSCATSRGLFASSLMTFSTPLVNSGIWRFILIRAVASFAATVRSETIWGQEPFWIRFGPGLRSWKLPNQKRNKGDRKTAQRLTAGTIQVPKFSSGCRLESILSMIIRQFLHYLTLICPPLHHSNSFFPVVSTSIGSPHAIIIDMG